MARLHTITPCLWFDSDAEEAAILYTSLFPNSRITQVSRFSETGRNIHGRNPGTAMTVAFELSGQPFTALNGGPKFTFNESISMQIGCDSQEEVDHYWNGLGRGGDPAAQRCGWLKDRFGLSWQVIPSALIEMLTSTDRVRSGRAMEAMLTMKKFEISELRRAFDGR
jgi:predicted 3-demethylubiquinone-9 3-methyltransferase (glyoxalase superfamily)